MGEHYVVYCNRHRNGVTGPFDSEVIALEEAYDASAQAQLDGQNCYFDIMPFILLDGWTLTKRERGRGQYL